MTKIRVGKLTSGFEGDSSEPGVKNG